MEIVRITDEERRIVEPELLALAEPIHRQLRPDLPKDYSGRMRQIFATGGEMCVAVTDEAVVGVAVFRSYENTHAGKRLYVDDLVTAETYRSSGVGHALLGFLERLARARGGDSIDLDSGTHRTRAHRFYFREGYVIPAFVFKKQLP